MAPLPFEPESLPPKLDWVALVPGIGRANAALARYDGLIQGLTHEDLLLAPLRTREAVLSSRIEGTQATLVEVLEEEADPGAGTPGKRSDIQEVLNYRRAIQKAVMELETRPLSLNLLRRVHGVLMSGVRGSQRAPGEFRKMQNYIGSPGAGIDQAIYVPPPAQQVVPLLSDLEHYLHEDAPDPIVQIAVGHARFEQIHPFLDGNGRVGRILIPLFLYARGVISRPAFYMSAYLESHREEYYARLSEISKNGDHQGWVQFFLTAVTIQANEDTARVKDILHLHERMKQVVVDETRSKYALPALDSLFTHPLFSTPQFVKTSGIPVASASRLLKQLEDAQVLAVRRTGKGRRPTLWSFPQLLDLLR